MTAQYGDGDLIAVVLVETEQAIPRGNVLGDDRFRVGTRDRCARDRSPALPRNCSTAQPPSAARLALFTVSIMSSQGRSGLQPVLSWVAVAGGDRLTRGNGLFP